ncbi:MAG: DUF6364 family protein [Oceanipulchritudo sp.]
MKTKLTLTVEREAVLRMKRIAKRRGVSVSGMFEQWAKRMGESDTRRPLGERLRGKWSLAEDLVEDPRMEHLLRKHGPR